MAPLGEDDVEDSMRPAACLVHVGGGHSPARQEREGDRERQKREGERDIKTREVWHSSQMMTGC